MVYALALLLLCQLAGEVVVRATAIALPGPVLGMLLLLAGLTALRRAAPDLEATADGILRNLSLLFVPAAVGVVQHADALREYGVALVVALLVSTVLTLVVTAATFRLVARRLETRKGRGAR
jgi:holin-like protein